MAFFRRHLRTSRLHPSQATRKIRAPTPAASRLMVIASFLSGECDAGDTTSGEGGGGGGDRDGGGEGGGGGGDRASGGEGGGGGLGGGGGVRGLPTGGLGGKCGGGGEGGGGGGDRDGGESGGAIIDDKTQLPLSMVALGLKLAAVANVQPGTEKRHAISNPAVTPAT